MGFLSLLEVASMPVFEVLLIAGLGAVLATEYCNLLPVNMRRSLNKIVFLVFTPALMFSNLAQTVTLQDIISWWFMPINIGITFLIGTIIGWILVKVLKPEPYLEGLIIAVCSSGNMGNLPIIIVPAICDEEGSPFGGRDACRSVGLSYASFSMALGGFYIWTHTFQLIKNSSKKLEASLQLENETKEPNKDFDANGETHLLKQGDSETKLIDDPESQNLNEPANKLEKKDESFGKKLMGILQMILEELLSPPTVSAVIGFIFGAINWLRNLIIGDTAPLRVFQDSAKLLGAATIPCITLLLGGNLTQGLRASKIKTPVMIGVIIVRYVISPAIGIWVVKLAGNFGLLAVDPLYHYVLLIQYTLPPAMNIATMTELFNVGQEECSVIFLWTYLVAAFAITGWSTIFLWFLS